MERFPGLERRTARKYKEMEKVSGESAGGTAGDPDHANLPASV